jgi:response regulator RpfG family c-di-GMP phosphodiesterase
VTKFVDVRFDACVIDPDIGSRIRLKTAANSVYTFHHVVVYTSITESEERLREEAPFDIVFLSEKLPSNDVNQFIEKAKRTKFGEDAAYIRLVVTNDGTETAMAKAVIAGFDGCLIQPYSVEGLEEVAKLTAQVKAQLRSEREKAAIDCLLKEIIKHVDRLAFVQSAEMETGATFKQLKTACSSIQKFEPTMLEYYYQEAMKLFEQTPPNASLGERANYQGVSRRTKKKVAKHLITASQKEISKRKRQQ